MIYEVTLPEWFPVFSIVWGGLWLLGGLALAMAILDARNRAKQLAAIEALRQFVVDQPELDSLAEVIAKHVDTRLGGIMHAGTIIAELAAMNHQTVDTAIRERLPDRETLRTYLAEALVIATTPIPKKRKRGKSGRKKVRA